MSFHLSWNSENYNHAGGRVFALDEEEKQSRFRAEQAQLS